MNWQEKYKHKIVSFEEAAKKIYSGEKVMFSQANGEARSLIKAIVDGANELENVKLMSHLHWGPADYSKPGMEKAFKVYSNFLGANIRKDYQEGRVEFLPMNFFEMANYYENINKPDVALLTLSLPDENGLCSFGISPEYSVSLARGAKRIIAHINPSYPYTRGETIHLDKLDWIILQDEPLVEMPATKATGEEIAIGKFIAKEVVDGATLQIGIGGIPDAVLTYLQSKKDLGIHSEMISDGVVELYEKGIINNKRKKIDTGKIVANFATGTKKVFEFARNNPDLLMREVGYTNDPYIIAQNDNVVSINACMQVDLFGQVASDSINANLYSGVGGQVDFVRGARMSKGGKSILALRSTAKKGTISTIVCGIPTGTPITVSRYDVMYVCTEFGIVNLYGLTMSERAKALISIAHPKFREQLEKDAYSAGIKKDAVTTKKG